MTGSAPHAFAFLAATLIVVALGPASAQAPATPVPSTDPNTPLHLLKPDDPVPYGPTTPGIGDVLARVRRDLETATPAQTVDRNTGQPLADAALPGTEAAIDPGAFRITSYEWGVVYSGMLLASETTGDPAFKDYVTWRLALVATLADHDRAHPVPNGPIRSVMEPRALDNAGSTTSRRPPPRSTRSPWHEPSIADGSIRRRTAPRPCSHGTRVVARS